MKKISSQAQTVLALGGVALVFVLLAENRVKKAAAAVGQAVDPTSEKNVFNSGVDKVGQAVSGQKNWTLGSWVYRLTHDPIDKTTELPETLM